MAGSQTTDPAWIVMEVMMLGTLPRLTICAIYDNYLSAQIRMQKEMVRNPTVRFEVQEWQVNRSRQ